MKIKKEDYCTAWPEGHWAICCQQHDIDYETGGGIIAKTIADLKLAWCVAKKRHPINAVLMFVGVTLFGAPHFNWGKHDNSKHL